MSSPDQQGNRGLSKRRWLKQGVIILALLALVASGLTANADVVSIASTAAIYAIVAIGFNVLAGYTGQISLGHAGFFAIGAYTAGILAVSYNLPLLVTIPAAAVVSTLVGVIVAIPALRLKGPYIAIATLGFGVIVGKVAQNLDITGGSTGLQVPDPSLGFYTFHLGPNSTDNTAYFIFLLFIATLLYWAASNLLSSSTGRAFIALRDAPIAAQALGINLARFKVLAFAISAAYAGVAGALSINFTGHFGPDDFTLLLSILFLSMVVVGGLGTVWGSLIGAVLLTFLDSYLRHRTDINPELASPIYGLVIILVMLFLPEGVFGGLRKLTGVLVRRPAKILASQARTPDKTAETSNVAALAAKEE